MKAQDIKLAARPACILAGIGAVLAMATPASAQLACQVSFDVTNATTLRSMQFDIDYAGAADVGDFTNPSECTFSGGGIGDVGVDTVGNRAEAAWANTSAFTGPGTFVTCRFNASVAPVVGDFVPSLVEAESSTGVPASPSPVLSTSSVSCIEAPASCPGSPETGCKDATVAGKGKLLFKNNLTDDTKDQGQYQWKSGAATDASEFADPLTAGETFSWCVYKDGALVYGGAVPSGGALWKAAGSTGFQFKGDVGGIAQIKLKGGEAGKASVAVKGKSKLGNFSSPTLPFGSTNVVSQLLIDAATDVCFENTFVNVSKDLENVYSAKD